MKYFKTILNYGNLKSYESCNKSNRGNKRRAKAVNYVPRRLHGFKLSTSDIHKIVKIQRMVRRALMRIKMVKIYLKLCNPDMNQDHQDNVVETMRRLPEFHYLSEQEESQMGFKPRKFRPLAKISYLKGFGHRLYYFGQWRVGEDIIEGRGVMFTNVG